MTNSMGMRIDEHTVNADTHTCIDAKCIGSIDLTHAKYLHTVIAYECNV